MFRKTKTCRPGHLVFGTCLVLLSWITSAQAQSLEGTVLDINGNPVQNMMITVYPTEPGPTAITVFSNESGAFTLPVADPASESSQMPLEVRSLTHELVSKEIHQGEDGAPAISLIARPVRNQVDTAPASAWLSQLGEPEATATFIQDCIGCHQVPAPEFRAWVTAMDNIPGDDRQHIVREGWSAMVKYMNFLSAEEFARGPEAASPEAVSVYSVGNDARVVDYLSSHFNTPMDRITGYDWGAPLAVTTATNIREYEVAEPNAVREALLLGEPRQLWVADVASNRMYKIDPDSGHTSFLEVPADTITGPHSLHRGEDGSLWVAPFISSVVARLDVETETWETWSMRTVDGQATGIHDLSFGADHTLLTDRDGNIWFSDISNNAVGYLDPDTGAIEIYPAPTVPDRSNAGAALYGLIMTSDRETVWYSQLGIGSFGSFNTTTREFTTPIVLDENAGPRRLSISDEDILYVPLYGAGQLVEYDTRNHVLIGIHDLPDRASAPYAVTWDPVRRVVWIPTSNADVIYRFDPRDKSFTVLPLPRSGAMLRMVDVDPDTGYLITSYANIVEQVHGPRMALIIDPGDSAYSGTAPVSAR